MEYIKSKSKLGIGLIIMCVGFILTIYILRSGNFKILRASALELRIREILEYNFKVRVCGFLRYGALDSESEND